MADRPILFSAPMVRALLEGRKTQTRRVLKPQPHDNDFCSPCMFHPTRVDRHGEEHPGPAQFGIWAPDGFWTQRLPYAPRDRLWVREALRFDHSATVPFTYDADGARVNWGNREQVVWLNEYPRSKAPGIHMPRWASRLTLLVTAVRVQRLQDISEADALAEGVQYSEAVDLYHVAPFESDTAAGAFESLWNSINGPDAWAANPWVAAITFEVVRSNIDQVQP